MDRTVLEAERASIEADPAGEFEELVGIYKAKGLNPRLARQVAEALTELDPVAAHADAELRLGLSGPRVELRRRRRHSARSDDMAAAGRAAGPDLHRHRLRPRADGLVRGMADRAAGDQAGTPQYRARECSHGGRHPGGFGPGLSYLAQRGAVVAAASGIAHCRRNSAAMGRNTEIKLDLVRRDGRAPASSSAQSAREHAFRLRAVSCSRMPGIRRLLSACVTHTGTSDRKRIRTERTWGMPTFRSVGAVWRPVRPLVLISDSNRSRSVTSSATLDRWQRVPAESFWTICH
jgi:hypothetical protein